MGRVYTSLRRGRSGAGGRRDEKWISNGRDNFCRVGQESSSVSTSCRIILTIHIVIYLRGFGRGATDRPAMLIWAHSPPYVFTGIVHGYYYVITRAVRARARSRHERREIAAEEGAWKIAPDKVFSATTTAYCAPWMIITIILPCA